MLQCSFSNERHETHIMIGLPVSFSHLISVPPTDRDMQRKPVRSFIPCHLIILGGRSAESENLRLFPPVSDFHNFGSRLRTSRRRIKKFKIAAEKHKTGPINIALRTVPAFVGARTFCASRKIRLKRALVLTMTQSPTMDSKETETKPLLTPDKTNEIKDNKPCILARLRYIFAIFSSQISAMMERSDAILRHEKNNRRCKIYPRDVRFQSSLFTIHAVTKSVLMNLFLNQEH